MPPVTRPASFLLIALALLLAPFGICLQGGPAMAAPAHDMAMHHHSASGAEHHEHGSHGKFHHCAECQPPSFVKAGKVAVPDVAPVSAALVPVGLAPRLRPGPPAEVWGNGPATRAPPFRRSYRIRLQI